ncbi:hypothetical protein OS493_031632 [Desmophyllum pertusum]|uniref:Uncharacterized protein n=1 Tax=Desmophyllum pertusum TaxID=174260 RepID=A0A9W9Y8I9_9CNID|nr:hypothetical protein OS493_031632 [Desmophyllum pertusum]
MGLALSSYKSKRKEKKYYKRKLKKQLKEAEECITRLLQQLQLENESLDQHQSSAGSRPEAETAHVDCEVAEMEGDVQALERKLFLEEIAVNVTDERCDFLDKNYRQAYISVNVSSELLQNNESGLHRQSLMCHASLEELKLKQEACQFSQFQKA